MPAKNPYVSAFIILTTLFFMWGFITCLNDLLIPHLKEAFNLKYWQAMLIQTAFFGAYFIISLIYFLISATSGDPISRIGYQNGLVIGLVICGIGCLLFYPAAEYAVYGWFLVALFVLASGVTIIQISANPYAAILGPEETASSRLNLAQGLNSLGYVIAPVIGGILIFGDRLAGAESVKIPYLGLAVAFFALAVVFKLIRLPAFTHPEETKGGASVLRNPFFIMGMIAIFVYVGGEVAVGSVFINYLGLDEVMGFDDAKASKFLSYYWGGLMIGRLMGAISLSNIKSDFRRYGYMLLAAVGSTFIIFIASSRDWTTFEQLLSFSDILPYIGLVALNFGAFMLGKAKPGRMISLFALIAIGLLLVSIVGKGSVAMWTIIGVGLFNSIMWSNIFTLSIRGLGKHTSQGSSLLVMMILGGAIVPPLQGALADWDLIGLKYSLAIVILCYLYLAFFGFMASRRNVQTE